MLRMVRTDRLPRRFEPPRRWRVLQGFGVAKRVQNRVLVIGEAALRRIRSGQIQQRLPCRAMPRERLAQAVWRQIPFRAFRKHVLFDLFLCVLCVNSGLVRKATALYPPLRKSPDGFLFRVSRILKTAAST